MNPKDPKLHIAAGFIAGLIVGFIVYFRLCGFVASFDWFFGAFRSSIMLFAPLGAFLFWLARNLHKNK